MNCRNLVLATIVAVLAVAVTAQAQTAPAAQPASPAQAVAATPAAPAAVAPPKNYNDWVTVPLGPEPVYLKAETAAERLKRIATQEDPGPDPDPKKIFVRFGQQVHIEKYDRRWAKFDGQPFGWVRPLGMVNVGFELYQINNDSVWVWVPEPNLEKEQEVMAEAAAPPQTKFGPGDIAFLKKARPEFTVLEAPKSSKVIRFEESSEGLPKTGSWRNTVAVADMNGDGFLDIVAPAQRGSASNNLPAIFLGDGKGHWKFWDKVQFPHGIDYGGVVAADFNKDGHMDLAFAVHLSGVYIFLGDGKGKFTEVNEGVGRDFGSRRLRVADVNADGWPDVVALTEGPSARGMSTTWGPMVMFVNNGKGTAFPPANVIATGVRTGGDWMSVGNFNGDKYPDYVLSSIYFNSWDVIYQSNAKNLKKNGLQWDSYGPKNDGSTIPSIAYYFANTTGKFSSKDRDDAIVVYVRTWPTDLDTRLLERPANMQITGLDRLSFAKNGAVTRTPIMRWAPGDEAKGLAAGDFDHDGNLDLILTRNSPREAVILLGDGKGGFRRAEVEGLTLDPLDNYDIVVADVNGDGLPDVIIPYEASNQKNSLVVKNGSIKVFLNKGVAPAAAAKPAAVKK